MPHSILSSRRPVQHFSGSKRQNNKWSLVEGQTASGLRLVFTMTSVFLGGLSVTSKWMMWVYCLGVCRPVLPGLVGAIVPTLPAAAMKQSQRPCTYNAQHTNTKCLKSYSCSSDTCQNTDGVALWYYVTAITHRDVTRAGKQSFKQLCSVPKRWPEQTHCDLCAHVFPLCFPYAMTRARLPLYWAFKRPRPRLRSHSRANTIYVGWQRGIHFQQIPLLLNCCLLSLTLSPNPHKAPAFGHKYLNKWCLPIYVRDILELMPCENGQIYNNLASE